MPLIQPISRKEHRGPQGWPIESNVAQQQSKDIGPDSVIPGHGYPKALQAARLAFLFSITLLQPFFQGRDYRVIKLYSSFTSGYRSCLH